MGIFKTLISVSLIAASWHGQACTTFSITRDGQTVLGKTYDWSTESGYLMTNKRNVAKTAIALKPTDVKMSWVSKLGSVTFNQYGRELPNAGINEKGLAIEVMVLGESVFPAPSTMPSVNETQWVQYLLDSAESVDEAIALAGNVRLSNVAISLHYILCDASGACAGVEFLNGEMKVWQKETFPFPSMTNATYPNQIAYLPNFVGFGGSLPLPTTDASRDRFVRMADHIMGAPLSHKDLVSYARDGLNKVQTNTTLWKIVYDHTAMTIFYESKSQPRLKSIKANAFDFACKTPVQMLPLINELEGDVTDRFSDYKAEKNKALVRENMESLAPPVVVDIAAQYPETTRCTED